MQRDEQAQIESKFTQGIDTLSGKYFYACEYRRAGQERWYVIVVFNACLETAMIAVHRAFLQLIVKQK